MTIGSWLGCILAAYLLGIGTGVLGLHWLQEKAARRVLNPFGYDE